MRTDSIIDNFFGISCEYFLKEYSNKKTLLKHNNAEKLKTFFNIESNDIGVIVSKYFDSPERVRSVSDGNSFPAARLMNGQLDVDQLWKKYKDGTSTIFNSAHKFNESFSAAAQDIVRNLGYRVQANLYLSPPNSKALSLHYDQHDVIVLQLVGDKEWTVYEVPDQKKQFLMQKGRYRYTKEDASQIPTPIMLSEGSALYLPRGTLHAAKALTKPSLHVTFSLEPITMADCIRSAIDTAGQEQLFFSSHIGSMFGKDTDPLVWKEMLEEAISYINTKEFESCAIESLRKQCVDELYPTVKFPLFDDV